VPRRNGLRKAVGKRGSTKGSWKGKKGGLGRKGEGKEKCPEKRRYVMRGGEKLSEKRGV